MLYPDESVARRENGYYCPANLPRPGERVDVADDASTGLQRRTATVISSQPASQASLYGASGSVLQPVPGFESDCSVTVKYDDGTTGTVSAAEQPKSLLEELAPVVGYGVYGALSFLSSSDGDDAWERAKARHDELLDELEIASRPDQAAQKPLVQPPVSGEYWGSSEESDEGDQAVRCTVTFERGGTVTGRGTDGVDGAYRITDGRWGALDSDSKLTVGWIERYDQGFEVAVKGRYDVGNGKITARFTSSRGVSGAFELTLKPSIF